MSKTESAPRTIKKNDSVIIMITEYKGNPILQITDLNTGLVFRAGASNVAPIVANMEAALTFLKESETRAAAPAIEAFDKSFKKR